MLSTACLTAAGVRGLDGLELGLDPRRLAGRVDDPDLTAWYVMEELVGEENDGGGGGGKWEAGGEGGGGGEDESRRMR